MRVSPANCAQAQAPLMQKMSFRPASLTSKFHQRLSRAVGKQHVKKNKVQATVTVVDPQKLKAEREKAEEEKIKSR